VVEGRNTRRAHVIACGVFVAGSFCGNAAAEPLSSGIAPRAPLHLEAPWESPGERSAPLALDLDLDLDLGLGIGEVATATVLAAAHDMPQSERAPWITLAPMPAGFARALYNLLLESRIESHDRPNDPDPTTPTQPLSVKVSTVRKGGALKLYGRF
jgi:hypothetical protein